MTTTPGGKRVSKGRFGLYVACVVSMWLAATAAAFAQDHAFAWDPRSGDDWVDAQLQDINAYAARYPDAFIDELVRYQAAPRVLVTALLVGERWAPGDVYFACAVAKAAGEPCRELVQAWTRGHAEGWRDVSAPFEVQPGSREFANVKRGIVASYDRWSRPLELDRELRKALPGRAATQSERATESR